MTGNEIFHQALTLLGYTTPEGAADGAGDGALLCRALPLINQLYADLWFSLSAEPFVPLTSLSAPLPLPERAAREVMPYGVAMLLAQTESDGDGQALYAALFNRKRRALSQTETVTDVFAGLTEEG